MSYMHSHTMCMSLELPDVMGHMSNLLHRRYSCLPKYECMRKYAVHTFMYAINWLVSIASDWLHMMWQWNGEHVQWRSRLRGREGGRVAIEKVEGKGEGGGREGGRERCTKGGGGGGATSISSSLPAFIRVRSETLGERDTDVPSTLDANSTDSTNQSTIHSNTVTSSSQASYSERLSQGSSSIAQLAQQTLSQDVRMGDIDESEDEIEDFDDDIIWWIARFPQTVTSINNCDSFGKFEY